MGEGELLVIFFKLFVLADFLGGIFDWQRSLFVLRISSCYNCYNEKSDYARYTN